MATEEGERKADGRITVEVPATTVQGKLSMWLNRTSVRGDRIIVTRHGNREAALVPISDLEKLEALDGAA